VFILSWPLMARYKEDLVFLKGLPGLEATSPKGIAILYYSISTKVFSVRAALSINASFACSAECLPFHLRYFSCLRAKAYARRPGAATSTCC
jgi:hypothetical protein